jgi:gliding motility-associated-like protein
MQHKILIKYLLWIVSVVGLSWEANAQVNNDCRQVFNTNRLICGTASFTDNSNGTGQVNEFNATDFPNNNRGCLLSGERQSAWYAFQVGTSGTITFTIIPNNMSNDYDFAVWGPFNNSGAVSLCQNLGTPIRCNYSGTSGLTGLNSTSTQASVGAGGSPFSSAINATAGQLYILMVDNFSTSNSGFTFVWNNNNFTMPNGTVVNGGGGTASLSPLSAGFSAPTLSCNRATFTNTSSTCKTGAGVSMSYSWNFGDGQPVSGVNTQANPTYFFSAPGTYTVTLTATLNSNDEDNGKTSTYTQQVVITGTPPTASITGLNANYCIDSPPVILTGTGNPAGGTSTFTIERNVVAGVPAQTLTSQTQFNPATLGIGNHNVILEYSSPTNANCRRRVVQAVRVNDKPIADITGLASSYCPGSPAVNLVGTPAGGTFTVNGTPATQFNPTSLGVGTHTVVYTVTDALTTCTISKTQTVSISGVATPAITGLNASYCVGGSAFNLVGTPAGGTFTINGTPATQFNPATLGIGNHVVAYTLSGCPASATQNVSVTANPTLSFTGLNTQYCISTSPFNLAATPAGGTFKINNVVVTQFNPATLGVGTHIVRYEYTDPTNSSCSNFITQNVQVINPATINFVGLNTSYCVSASAFTLNATPAGGTFTINGTAATQFDPGTLGVGNHTVIYSVTDGNGCPNIHTQNVQVTALPVLTNNVAVSYCLSSAAFTMTGTPAGSTFTINGTPATQFNPAILGIGDYTVAQSFTDANGCSNTLTKTVTINVKPVLNFVSLNTSYCMNVPTFTLQATPTGGTFTVNGTPATQFNPALLGVGSHIVKYNYVSPSDPGCFNEIEQTVEVKAIPNVSIIGLNSVYCVDAAGFALAGSPAGGTFTINNVAATQFNPTTLGAGLYNVVYSFTDVNGCTSTATQSVNVNPLPTLSFNNLKDNYCLSSASFNLSATPAGGTFTINGNPATQFNPATLGLGTYNVVYSLTDANGCSNQINKNVNITPKPTLNFVGLNNAYCVSEPSFNLQATPTGGTFTINGVNATQFNPSTLGAGNYVVKYNYIDPSDTGCFDEITQNVVINPLPQIQFQNVNANYCVSSLTPVNPVAFVTYGNGTTQNVPLTSFIPANQGTGTQTISFTAIDPLTNCQRISTFNYTINALPTLNFVNVPDQYCYQSGTLTLQATPAGGTFKVQGTNTNVLNPSLFTIGQFVNIEYTFTDGNSCSNVINKTVELISPPNYTESVENVDVCPGTLGTKLEALTLQEEIALISSGVQVRYSWSNGSTSRFITLRNANDSGTYVVLISDGTGCPIKKVTFNAVISCEPKLILPTAFSPNGDGLNDTWDIFGKDLAKLDLRVYNRWGETVFIAYSQETRWDGSYNGMPLPAGTYVWKAKYVNALNQEEVVVKQGMVTIVK